MDIDRSVHVEDARPAGKPGECFYCSQPLGEPHKDGCVILSGRAFDAVEPYVWHPISTLHEGEHVALYWPIGERGGPGGIEMATVYFNDGDGWSYWTHGGPNSGDDWTPRDDEKPTMWMRVIHPAP